MATPVTIPKTARDILLAKVGEFVADATRKRTDGEHEDALSLYQRATEILQALINNETDETFKQKLEIQLADIKNEKETLSQEQSILVDIPSSEDARSRRESTSCEVVMSIENVSIHKILGLGAGAPERVMIGQGVLRILRCQPPPESPSSQKPQLEKKTETELEEDLESERKGKTTHKGLCLLQLLPTTSDDQFQFPLTEAIPCLCTAPGYYIFPMPGNLFYGIVFPSNIPQAYVSVFEGVLDGCCNLRKVQMPPGFHAHHPPPPTESHEEKALTTVSTSTEIIVAPPETSVPLAAKALNTLSSGINTGANALVEGITTGSQKLAAGARSGSEFIRSRITPSPEPAKVPEPVVSTVYVAGKLSPVCVAVSKVLITSLAAIADEVGKTVAKGITASKSNKPSTPSGPTATAAKQVGKTSLQAFVNIWEALEQAGKLLLSETSNITVELVDTKYGAQAAEVTKAGLNVAGDVVMTAYNLDQLGLKQIATKAAKQAGKHTVKGIMGVTDDKPALPAPQEKLALPAPDENLALPAPDEKLALPAPHEKLALPAPHEKLALPAPEEKTNTPSE
eukprot:Phypoly_transcript_06302.p1 GENE.Phypoly_transcript_06302~~Phypoly_transcript_06302.p1  ORF type:complete len:569 (+),score=132.21 Phypoly_transcript_06302:42-1748(+)